MHIFTPMKTATISKRPEYSVHRQFTDGYIDIVCQDVNGLQAAQEFWRCTKNISAYCGLVEQVALVNGNNKVDIGWQQGRGYTYDGKTFYEHPIPEGDN